MVYAFGLHRYRDQKIGRVTNCQFLYNQTNNKQSMSTFEYFWTRCIHYLYIYLVMSTFVYNIYNICTCIGIIMYVPGIHRKQDPIISSITICLRIESLVKHQLMDQIRRSISLYSVLHTLQSAGTHLEYIYHSLLLVSRIFTTI